MRLILPMLLVLAACVAPQTMPSNHMPSSRITASSGHVIAPPPPEVIAKGGDLSAVEIATRLERLAEIRARPSVKRVPFDSLALLRDAPEAAAYRAAPRSRALSMGWPSKTCPALASAGADSATEAAQQATRSCFAQISDRPACGCRLMAVDGVLLAPIDQFAHARAVTVELRLDGQRITLIAEEASDAARDTRAWWLLDPLGPVARLTMIGDQVSFTIVKGDDGAFRPGRTLKGTAEKLGLRRGNLAIRATFEQGASLTLGLEPEELRQQRPLDLMAAQQ